MDLPPEILVFCLVMGWKTALAIVIVALLMLGLNAFYKWMLSLQESKSSFRNSGKNAWFWIVSFASAGAIWAAERAEHPSVAAVLALLTIVAFLYMDQPNVSMDLEVSWSWLVSWSGLTRRASFEAASFEATLGTEDGEAGHKTLGIGPYAQF